MRSWRLEVAEAEAEIQRLKNWQGDVQSGTFRSGSSPDGVSLPVANDISVEEIAERIAVQERRLRLLMEREAAS